MAYSFTWQESSNVHMECAQGATAASWRSTEKTNMPNNTVVSVDLKKLLSNAQLPALPQSAIRLLEMSRDPSNGPAKFAAPIESDPGLAGQVLRFVNSSYFGFANKISSVKLAITLVGVRTIKNFALWSAVFSLMPNPRCGPFDLRRLWQDSLRRALFARAVGKLLGMKEPEEAFSAALLQDMAVPLLAREVADLYKELLETRDQRHVRLSVLERQALQWTHAEAGAMLARQWHLPEGFVALIENHLDVERWFADPRRDPGNAAVSLSALLPAVSDPMWYECGQFEMYYEKIRSPGSPGLTEMLGRIDVEFADFAPVLKLDKPSKSLVQTLEEATAAAQT
jgi:HD-like signal output (HDOD) protein